MDKIEQKGLVIAFLKNYPRDKVKDWVAGFAHGYRLGLGVGRGQARDEIAKRMLAYGDSAGYTINIISEITSLFEEYIESLQIEEGTNNDN